jgi:hypothetical protein
VALLLCVLCGALWWRAIHVAPYVGDSLERYAAERWYVCWKILFTLSALIALWLALRLKTQAWRQTLTTCVLLVACFVEPMFLIARWWPGTAKTPARCTTPAQTTRFLQQFPPAEQRVYVRANSAAEEMSSRPRFDALDRTAPFGLHNVAGYEPLILERYSRALGNVEFDAINPRPGFAANRALFDSRSHVLDLLNAAYVVAWPDLSVTPAADALIERDGVRFAAAELGLTVAPGQSVTLRGAPGTGDTLALVTSLANSAAVKQATTVARLRVFSADGRIIERELRAGLDTSEWAHERQDVRANVRHALAPVFDSRPGDAANSFAARRYWTRLALGAGVAVSRVEVENVSAAAALALWKATLFDSAARRSVPLTNEPDATTLDAARWQVAADMDGVLVLRNLRALPRAWLVAEAEAVDGEEALRRISGESPKEFDPRRTALLEVRADELPQLSDAGATWGRMAAHVAVYEPGHILIDTDASTPTVLVVSETFYPGWVATVDGQPAPILLTDYLLRGVALDAGRHRVEMRYTAPAARTGALISGATLLLIGGLFIYDRRRGARTERRAGK